jgi:hypothetical protein
MPMLLFSSCQPEVGVTVVGSALKMPPSLPKKTVVSVG